MVQPWNYKTSRLAGRRTFLGVPQVAAVEIATTFGVTLLSLQWLINPLIAFCVAISGLFVLWGIVLEMTRRDPDWHAIVLANFRKKVVRWKRSFR